MKLSNNTKLGLMCAMFLAYVWTVMLVLFFLGFGPGLYVFSLGFIIPTFCSSISYWWTVPTATIAAICVFKSSFDLSLTVINRLNDRGWWPFPA